MDIELKQLYGDFLACFEHDAGKRILEELDKKYGNRSSFVKGDPYETAFNEGRREVLLYLKRMLAKARNPEKEQIKVKT